MHFKKAFSLRLDHFGAAELGLKCFLEQIHGSVKPLPFFFWGGGEGGWASDALPRYKFFFCMFCNVQSYYVLLTKFGAWV